MVATQDRQRHAAAVGMLTRMMQEAEARAMQHMPRRPKLAQSSTCHRQAPARSSTAAITSRTGQQGIRFAGQATPLVRKRMTTTGMARVYKRLPLDKAALPQSYQEHFGEDDGLTEPQQQDPQPQNQHQDMAIDSGQAPTLPPQFFAPAGSQLQQQQFQVQQQQQSLMLQQQFQVPQQPYQPQELQQPMDQMLPSVHPLVAAPEPPPFLPPPSPTGGFDGVEVEEL